MSAILILSKDAIKAKPAAFSNDGPFDVVVIDPPWPRRATLALLDRREETAMYDTLIMKNGNVPMTRRIDILKIIAVAAAIGILLYYLAHRAV